MAQEDSQSDKDTVVLQTIQLDDRAVQALSSLVQRATRSASGREVTVTELYDVNETMWVGFLLQFAF